MTLLAQGDGWCLNNYRGIFGSRAVGGDYSIETVTSSDNVSGYCLSSYGYTSPGSEIYEFGCALGLTRGSARRCA